jgi:hypothetical protein
MKNTLGMFMVGATMLLSGACLQKDAHHTLYLSPDGAVSWTVDESGVFSDDADAGKRAAEEQEYIGPALIGSHSVANAFKALGPQSLVRTHVLRDQPPFHVVTDASFLRIDDVFNRVFKEAGVEAKATLTVDGERTSLRVRFDFRDESLERESAVLTMLRDVDDVRFVLTEGRFVAGGGFDVPDRRRAVVSPEWIEAAGEAMEAHRAIELVLTWNTDSLNR